MLWMENVSDRVEIWGVVAVDLSLDIYDSRPF